MALRPRRRRRAGRRDRRAAGATTACSSPGARTRQRAAFLLRLRHAGAEAPSARRSHELLAWPTRSCGSAISTCGRTTACRCSATPCCCAARRAPRSSSSRIWSMSALSECERFYPAFQFVIWGGKHAGRSGRPRRCSIRSARPEPPLHGGADDTRRGSILLVGCGKMGGALLAGWLGRRRRRPTSVRRRARREGGGRVARAPQACTVRDAMPEADRAFAPASCCSRSSRRCMAEVAAAPIGASPAGHRLPVDRRRQDHRLLRAPPRPRGRGRARHAQHAGRGRPRHHRACANGAVSAEQRGCCETLMARGRRGRAGSMTKR